MIELNSDQWELYSKKYSKLMWKIAHRISGDTMTASLEDNYSDLSIAAIESINGFHKKTGKSFDEMIQMKLFDQYTKTCLWTAKARKGIKLTERMPFRNKHISIDSLRDDPDTSFDIPDTSSVIRMNKVDAKDAVDSYPDKLKKMVDVLQNNPTLFTESGSIKVNPLAKEMGLSVDKVKNLISLMEKENDSN
jgi:hypothetical protein